MIGQPQCHGRRAVVIATQTLRSRQPQGRMSPPEIMIKELQAEQGIEGGIAFGKGMRLTCEGTEPIPHGAVESFDMQRPGWLHARSQHGAGLHRQESPVLVPMLDRLRQAERLWHNQPRTPPFAGVHRLAIGAH